MIVLGKYRRKLILFAFGTIIVSYYFSHIKTRGICKIQTTYNEREDHNTKPLGYKSIISKTDQNLFRQNDHFFNSRKYKTLIPLKNTNLDMSPVPTRDWNLMESPEKESTHQIHYKTIAVIGELPKEVGISPFEKCPKKDCILSLVQDIQNTRQINASVVLFDITNFQYAKQLEKIWNQIWILNLMESPLNTPNLTELRNLINWTATYRTDATIYTPYDEYKKYQGTNRQRHPWHYYRDLIKTKTNSVAWFVTNCGSKNGRLKYVLELQRYIGVDIYGLCGTLHCGRESDNLCLEILRRKYKFYLSFENSNCKDYITEKFWKAIR